MGIRTEAMKGEFGHVGLGDDQGTGAAQPAYHQRIDSRRRAFFGQYSRARARDFARHVEQVFDAYNCTVERSEGDSELGACIGGICRGTRGISVDSKTGAAAFAGWISDPGECLLKSVSGRGLRHSQTISQATAASANRPARL
jgi:hypothetical protein